MKKLLFFLTIGFMMLVSFSDKQDCYFIESSVNEFEISKPVTDLLGNSYKKNEPKEVIFTRVLNDNKTQKLDLIFHPGHIKHYFSEVHLSQFHKEDTIGINYSHTKDSIFYTSCGIYLGMPDSLLQEKLPNCFEKSIISNKIIYSHVRNDFENDSLLIKFNMPEYYIKYYVENGIVENIKFGFTYP